MDRETDDSTESSIRYTAYANRLRTILQASHRYVAYTSDIGESFRPVAHPNLVTFGYGISWAYLIGDVAFESWKARMNQQGTYYPGLKPWETDKINKLVPSPEVINDYDDFDWKIVGLKRAVFQGIASMGLPAVTIHSTVRYSSLLFKNSSIKNVKTYGPVVLGLGIVPILPYLFDEPVEHAVDTVFSHLFTKTQAANKQL